MIFTSADTLAKLGELPHLTPDTDIDKNVLTYGTVDPASTAQKRKAKQDYVDDSSDDDNPTKTLSMSKLNNAVITPLKKRMITPVKDAATKAVTTSPTKMTKLTPVCRSSPPVTRSRHKNLTRHTSSAHLEPDQLPKDLLTQDPTLAVLPDEADTVDVSRKEDGGV